MTLLSRFVKLSLPDLMFLRAESISVHEPSKKFYPSVGVLVSVAVVPLYACVELLYQTSILRICRYCHLLCICCVVGAPPSSLSLLLEMSLPLRHHRVMVFQMSWLINLLLMVATVNGDDKTKPQKQPPNFSDDVGDAIERHLHREQHDKHEHHDVSHDQAKFLGKHVMPEFAKLNPNRASESLKTIFKETDKNDDGFIDFVEMYARLKHVEDEFNEVSAQQQWTLQNPTNASFVTWEMIMNNTYGFLEQNDTDEMIRKSGEKYMARDKVRFSAADLDKDAKLSRSEYSIFVNPGASNSTKHILLDEIFGDMDTNKDGFVDFDEFIAEIYQKTSGDDPEWIKAERVQFREYRDRNKDGKLDRSEVRDMFFPENYDPVEAESHHLIEQADDNKDSKLSLDEIQKHSEMFVNSPVAHWERNGHDEL